MNSADRLNLTVGAVQYGQLELGYGYTASGAQAPLGVNFAVAGDQGFRLTFAAINGDYNLNFTIVAYLAGGLSQYSVPLSPSPGPLIVDCPFGAFVGPGAQNFSNVSYLAFFFQTFDDIALDSIETRQ